MNVTEGSLSPIHHSVPQLRVTFLRDTAFIRTSHNTAPHAAAQHKFPVRMVSHFKRFSCFEDVSILVWLTPIRMTNEAQKTEW
jgi:hypothetical protein